MHNKWHSSNVLSLRKRFKLDSTRFFTVWALLQTVLESWAQSVLA
jgi:hypothetical protein